MLIDTRNARARSARFARSMIVAVAAISASIQSAPAFAIGTSFTYQGQLKKNNTPFSGNADFSFQLYTAPTGGTLLATVNQTSVPVSAGLFTTPLDFGSVFDGTPRWLEIRAATNGEGFTALTPRQEIKSVPYAVRAENGGTGGSQWTTNGSSIFYNGGHVGIGVTDPIVKLQVDSGTENTNAGCFLNNNAVFPTFCTQNLATGGFGWYDAWSTKHYVQGLLGIGIDNPAAKLDVVGSVPGSATGIKATSFADGPGGTTDAAIWGIGDGSTFVGPCAGVIGQADVGNGIEGYAQSSAYYGGYFRNLAGGTALFSDGLAQVRTLQILGGADLVEGFDVREGAGSDEKPGPGSVLIIDDENPGQLRSSRSAYDQKVAGVVSGAGGVEHGIKLGQGGKLDGETNVAMTGRVYVKCTTENGAIRAGDRLTTSNKTGHAMRATSAQLSDGAVIGKAMSLLESGTGLVLVLVNLQ